ncbi:MAG TPA: coproporphyrinogen-III oxidase family protein [Terriglobales bacterium]|nr:coproporphyrinogen-III oxidase family protein [Terriglobales bacterium]
MTKPRPPIALYVHLPFCLARCPYCDFVVYAGGDARGPRARTERLYEAVGRELEVRADALDVQFGRPPWAPAANPADPAAPVDEAAPADFAAPREPLRSVYFGGGTPSLVPVASLDRLMAIVRARFGVAPDAEVTLEANPGPDERGDLAAFCRAGVTRVSFGAQSLDAGELRRLGRRHSPEDVAAAVAGARAAGIGSVNLDLLYDAPGQSVAAWEATLRAALALAPDHLSLYGLTLDDPDAEGITGPGGDHLPTLPGARRWRERARLDQDDDRAADQYQLATDLLAAGGWRGYEISNWARPGHESRHNLAYWEREPYEAVGPGAHAFDGATRRWNAAAMEPYIAALLPHAGASAAPSATPSAAPPGGAESLTPDIARAEQVILALRLDRGVDEATASRPPLAAVREWAEAAGLLERTQIDGEWRVRLTTRGRLLSNELFSRLV